MALIDIVRTGLRLHRARKKKTEETVQVSKRGKVKRELSRGSETSERFGNTVTLPDVFPFRNT